MSLASPVSEIRKLQTFERLIAGGVVTVSAGGVVSLVAVSVIVARLLPAPFVR